MDIETLSDLIKRARDAYYNLEPIMSDQEYDALLEVLVSRDPKNHLIVEIGAAPQISSGWNKHRHSIPMGSLNKVNSKIEFLEWASNFPEEALYLSPKYDGISMELIYISGSLDSCVTRGDGYIGEDITNNVKYVPNVPKRINYQSNISVRGELILKKSVFNEKYASVYANPRNTVSGISRDFKAAVNGKVQDFDFIAYDCTNPLKTRSESISLLANMGFQTPSPSGSYSMNQIPEVFEDWSTKRKEFPYEIDGYVISIDRTETFEGLGHLNLRPRGAIAWKFDAATAITTVQDVTWTVGATGRITPVAKIAPTLIGGVTITNVSLQNLGMFKALKLSKNCRVLVSRRNDVIPYLAENLDID